MIPQLLIVPTPHPLPLLPSPLAASHTTLELSLKQHPINLFQNVGRLFPVLPRYPLSFSHLFNLIQVGNKVHLMYVDSETFLSLGEDSFDLPEEKVEDEEPGAEVGKDEVGYGECSRGEHVRAATELAKLRMERMDLREDKGEDGCDGGDPGRVGLEVSFDGEDVLDTLSFDSCSETDIGPAHERDPSGRRATYIPMMIQVIKVQAVVMFVNQTSTTLS